MPAPLPEELWLLKVLGEADQFKSVTPDKSTMFQGRAVHLRVCKQCKLDFIAFKITI